MVFHSLKILCATFLLRLLCELGNTPALEVAMKKKKVSSHHTAIRVPPKLLQACKKRADAQEMTFSEWLRSVLRKETQYEEKRA
jgi:predicted DNA binding CopG/RHH family protein